MHCLGEYLLLKERNREFREAPYLSPELSCDIATALTNLDPRVLKEMRSNLRASGEFRSISSRQRPHHEVVFLMSVQAYCRSQLPAGFLCKTRAFTVLELERSTSVSTAQ